MPLIKRNKINNFLQNQIGERFTLFVHLCIFKIDKKIKTRSGPLLDLNVFLELRNHISSDITLINIFIFFTGESIPLMLFYCHYFN